MVSLKNIQEKKMRVAVIGGGINGLGSGYVLAREDGIDEVVLFEKEESLGSHAKTIRFDGVDLDLGFKVFNRVRQVTYPNMMELYENLGVDMEVADMSFSLSLDNGKGWEWGSRNGLSSLFAQKRNILNPYFLQMMKEIMKFEEDVVKYIEELESNPDINRNETLGEFLKSHGYSKLFEKAYMVPACCSLWSCPPDLVLNFSAYSVLSFFRNHNLLQLVERPQWLTVAGGSQNYVEKVRAELERRGCKIRTSCNVQSVSTTEDGCIVVKTEDGSQEVFDRCILAVQAPEALRLLGKEATFDETRVLGAFQYLSSDVYLHRDIDLMPRNPVAWSAWNFLTCSESKASLTCWLNIDQKHDPILLTFNPQVTPKKTLVKWTADQLVPSVSTWKASQELHKIQGKRGLWFCGYGFHQDGIKAGIVAAQCLLRKDMVTPMSNSKHMVLSLAEKGARYLITRFMRNFISTGCVTFIEEGGSVFTFEGKDSRCNLKSVLKIHSPQFYWKVMTEADIGLADAYINGDFSFVDTDTGILNLIMIFIANKGLNALNSNTAKKRGWWTPMFVTSGLASAKYFIKHVSRNNTLTQSRRNISRHYDLSSEFFALFLGDTMSYSTAVFKSDDEDLQTAQMRKMSLLIDKAKIEKNHKVLEIGFGWGIFAIQVVRRTGCKYTGISLSIEQLNYAQAKVKEAGLEDRITFELCDYRQLPDAQKYDRIITCEMIEHVGHGYLGTFFSHCEAALAEDGIFVLQFISMPDEGYDEYTRSSSFIKEYIFPGGCLPTLARVTSAMASSSRLCVENVENIGIHYYKTLRCWSKNFMERQERIKELGFDDKFIRTWEYYFEYCAAGFKTLTLEDYQVVFSRPGNVAAFGIQYET